MVPFSDLPKKRSSGFFTTNVIPSALRVREWITGARKGSGGGEALHERLDTLAHGFGYLRVVLEVFDGFLKAAVDAVFVVEKIRGEFFEPFKIFFENLLAKLCIQARRGGLQLFKIEFGFFLRILHSAIVLPRVCR